MPDKNAKKQKEPPEPEVAETKPGAAEREAGADAEAPPPEPTFEELLAAERDKYLRLAAEFDNYRRRSQRERETLFADAKADTAARFLPLHDDIARAREQLENDAAKAEFFQVADMIKRRIDEVFAGLGVDIISAETETGKPFDPERHNAVMSVPPGDALSENAVAMVIQSGCAVGGRVTKHADVAVARIMDS